MEAGGAARPHLRLARPEDAPGVQAIYAPVVRDSVTSFELEPPSVEEVGARMATHDGVLPWLVCEAGGTVAGYAYASPHRSRWAYQWSVEVSVYVAAAHRRRSVGTSLYAALFGLLVQQGYARAYAGITMPNPASVALHRAMGFDPVGTYHRVGFKSGSWHDVGWWQRPLRDWGAATPAPPTPLRDIAESPDARRALAQATAGLRYER
jgi:L-amino acid N-acyltransferase YncA